MRKVAVLAAASAALLFAVLASAQRVDYCAHYASGAGAITVNPDRKVNFWTLYAKDAAITVSAWRGTAQQCSPSGGDSVITIPSGIAFTFRADQTDWLYITRESTTTVEVWAE